MGQYAEWEVGDSIARGDWDNGLRKGKASIGYNKAGLPTKACAANGVYSWLRGKYWPGAGKNTATCTTEDRIIARYGKEVLNAEQRPKVIANIISKEHWESFMKWVKETYK